MFQPKPKLDLKVPRSWNACTPEQLRSIASILMEAERRASTFSPVNDTDLKTRIFLSLAGLVVLSMTDEGFVVVGNKEVASRMPVAAEPFEIKHWQLQSWLYPIAGNGKSAQGVLDWLDPSSQDHLIVFPFPLYRGRLPILSGLLSIPTLLVFEAPAALMQDFTWQRYRYATDYMQLYVDQSNALIKAIRKTHVPVRKESAIAIASQRKELYHTRSLFLSVLHTPKGRDFDIGMVDRNARYFDCYSDIDFQCVLFWWQGMMHYLCRQYPHCFKKAADKPKKGRRNRRVPNPLEFYVSTVATLEKYVGLNEQQVNNENFHLPLQHLERIAIENEEAERMHK